MFSIIQYKNIFFQMIQKMITSFLIIGLALGCNQPSIQEFSTDFLNGILPTHLGEDLLNVGNKSLTGIYLKPKQQDLLGWIVTPISFNYTVNYTNVTANVTAGVLPNYGQVTVQNTSVTFYVVVNLTQGNNTAQGVAVVPAQFQYTFDVIPSNRPGAFYFLQLSYLEEFELEIEDYPVSHIYVNFPHNQTQLDEALILFNEKSQIQKSISKYYKRNQLITLMAAQIFNYQPKILAPVFNHSYSGSNVSYSVAINSVAFNFSVPGYFISTNTSVLNVGNETCANPLLPWDNTTTHLNSPAYYSLDLILNTLLYAKQSNLFTFGLNWSNWPVPYFSWVTAGLQSIIPSAATEFPLNSQLSGFCKNGNLDFLQVNNPGVATNTFSLHLQYECSIDVQQFNKTDTPIASVSVDFPNFEVGVRLNGTSLQFVAVNTTHTNTWHPIGNYTIANQQMANYFVDASIQKNIGTQSLFGSGWRTALRPNGTYTFTNSSLYVHNQ